MNNLLKLIILCVCVSTFLGCDDDGEGKKPTPNFKDQGVLILNQGGWSQNNAGVSMYSPKDSTMTKDIFNGGLGELAQDMIIYGSKLYISVYGSNLVSVVDMNSFTEITKISTNIDDSYFSPRFFTANNGKVYFTAQESGSRNGYTMRIDTTSLLIDKYTPVGINPEGITYYNNKLYVANSGPYVIWDNTLSVIDLETFEEVDKIPVGTNPYLVESDGFGKLYLTYKGNYNDIASGFQIVNAHTQTIEIDKTEYPIQNFIITDNLIYFYDTAYDDEGNSTSNGILQFDLKTNEFVNEPFVSTMNIEGTPYGINMHPVTKDIYLATSLPTERGKMYIFNSKGEFQLKETVGIFPCKFLFY